MTVWFLKNKEGDVIPPEEITSEQRCKLSKLTRDDLFPPKFSIDEIEPLKYNQDGTPKDKRWMNSFMCFRRVLGLHYKRFKIVFNGTELSQLAKLIWYGASEEERNIYKQISKDLRERHYQLIPNYVFRKAPKPTDDYINYGPETFERKRKCEDDIQRVKKRICKKDSESTNVIVLSESFNKSFSESFNESFSESDNKQPTSTTLNTVAYFPYDGQNFTEVEPFQQNNLCNIDSTADYTLWSQSFAPTVDPGMNMPLGFPENLVFPNENLNYILFHDGTNFQDTYEIPISCEVSLNESFDNSCCYYQPIN